MVDDTSSGTGDLRRATTRIVPTTFGMVLAVISIGSVLSRFAVADSSVMGLVWAGIVSVGVLGVVFPVVSVRFMRLDVVDAPSDLVVGQLGSVEIDLHGRASGLMIRCGRSPMYVLDLTSPDRVKLPLEIERRGVYDHLPVEISTDAPFSVLLASENRILPLRRELLVGPVVIEGTAELGEIKGEHRDEAVVGHAVSGDTVRSVRPYVSGDPSHTVHWPSSARLGSLVVREFEPPETEGVAVVLALRGEPGSGPVENAVSLAAGVVLNALDRGGRVVLCNQTTSGPVSEEVTTRRDVQRRLARAVPGPPPSAPEGWPTQVIATVGDGDRV